MNKWIVRLWGLLALVSLAMLVATTAWPGQGGNSDAELADSALHGFLQMRLQEHQRVRAVFVDEDESMVVSARKVQLYERPPGFSPSGRMRVTDWPVTPNPRLAVGSMLGFLKVPDEATGDRVLANYHEMLRRAAEEEPEALRAADVLLRRGFNASEVDRLLVRHGLDYMSCELKTPVSDGTAMTMWNLVGGPMILPMTGVPIAERVERDIGRWRYRFMHDSTLGGPSEMADKRREIALSREIGVYRVEVVGTQRALLAMTKEPEVRGVVAEPDGVRARGFEEWKSRAPQVPVLRQRVDLSSGSPNFL